MSSKILKNLLFLFELKSDLKKGSSFASIDFLWKEVINLSPMKIIYNVENIQNVEKKMSNKIILNSKLNSTIDLTKRAVIKRSYHWIGLKMRYVSKVTDF